MSPPSEILHPLWSPGLVFPRRRTMRRMLIGLQRGLVMPPRSEIPHRLPALCVMVWLTVNNIKPNFSRKRTMRRTLRTLRDLLAIRPPDKTLQPLRAPDVVFLVRALQDRLAIRYPREPLQPLPAPGVVFLEDYRIATVPRLGSHKDWRAFYQVEILPRAARAAQVPLRRRMRIKGSWRPSLNH